MVNGVDRSAYLGYTRFDTLKTMFLLFVSYSVFVMSMSMAMCSPLASCFYIYKMQLIHYNFSVYIFLHAWNIAIC